MRAARVRFTELLGVQWGPVMHMAEVEYRDGEGNDVVLPTTLSYSTGDPCLELIEETPGTVWVRNEHSNLHHLGFWTDGFVDASASLTASGCPLQLCGRAGTDAPVSSKVTCRTLAPSSDQSRCATAFANASRTL